MRLVGLRNTKLLCEGFELDRIVTAKDSDIAAIDQWRMEPSLFKLITCWLTLAH